MPHVVLSGSVDMCLILKKGEIKFFSREVRKNVEEAQQILLLIN
jgi:hypothetical protein